MFALDHHFMGDWSMGVLDSGTVKYHTKLLLWAAFSSTGTASIA